MNLLRKLLNTSLTFTGRSLHQVLSSSYWSSSVGSTRTVAAAAAPGNSNWIQQQFPSNYTSPPTNRAIMATPAAYQSDVVIDAARRFDAEGRCSELDPCACQILFPPPADAIESGTVKLGVIFFPGAFVDPRSYSPLLREISERYGLAAVVPIFDKDLAFKPSTCETGRISLAAKAFPYVKKWVLAGHSLGGTAAQTDLWSLYSRNEMDRIAGLVLIASAIRQDVGCGPIDFSNTTIPTASITASLDGIPNTYFEQRRKFLPINDAFYLEIQGGNHGQFGSYDGSDRTRVLGQHDGKALIPECVQQSLTYCTGCI